MDDSRNQRSTWNLFDQFGFPLLLLMLSAVCLFTVDYSVGKSFSSSKLHGEIKRIVDTTEHFGTPYGQILILLCLAAGTGWTDRRGIRIFVGTAAAGLAANLGKLLIARSRPKAFDFENSNIFDTFAGWFPFHSGGHAMEGFPSAHTASAFGFAAMLSWAYPKGRTFFIIMGLLVGVHRIATSAHFPSDVFAGAAIGWAIGDSFTAPNLWVNKKFAQLEQQETEAET